MGWGTLPHQIAPQVPTGGRLEVMHELGHFVHIEQPDTIATMILEFLERGR